MTLHSSSNLIEIISTIAYGTFATIIGVVTIYQGRRAWMMWHEHRHSLGNRVADVERGQVLSQDVTRTFQQEAPDTGISASIDTASEVNEIDSGAISHESMPPSIPLTTLMRPLGSSVPSLSGPGHETTSSEGTSHGFPRRHQTPRSLPLSGSSTAIGAHQSSGSIVDMNTEDPISAPTTEEDVSIVCKHLEALEGPPTMMTNEPGPGSSTNKHSENSLD